MEESRATIPKPEGSNRVQICVRHSTNLLSMNGKCIRTRTETEHRLKMLTLPIGLCTREWWG